MDCNRRVLVWLNAAISQIENEKSIVIWFECAFSVRSMYAMWWRFLSGRFVCLFVCSNNSICNFILLAFIIGFNARHTILNQFGCWASLRLWLDEYLCLCVCPCIARELLTRCRFVSGFCTTSVFCTHSAIIYIGLSSLSSMPKGDIFSAICTFVYLTMKTIYFLWFLYFAFTNKNVCLCCMFRCALAVCLPACSALALALTLYYVLYADWLDCKCKSSGIACIR